MFHTLSINFFECHRNQLVLAWFALTVAHAENLAKKPDGFSEMSLVLADTFQVGNKIKPVLFCSRFILLL